MHEVLVQKLIDFDIKFKAYFIHKKKLKAMNNYAEVADLEKKHIIAMKLIENFASGGFLEEEDVEYLNKLLARYEVKFSEWSHKTKWLKGHMKSISRQRGKAPVKITHPTLFDVMEEKQQQARAHA